MKKIDIGQSLANPNVARALSEFTVGMMNNSDVTKILREAIGQDKELENSSKKLIQAIESYNKKLLKKSRRVTISTDKDTKFIYPDLYEGTHPFERGAMVFYVDIINSKLISAIVNKVTTHETDRPTYLINYDDDHGMNTTRECEEYSLRSRFPGEDEKTPVAEQTKLWLAEVSWQKENHDINNKLSKLEEAIKKTEITKTDEPSVREQIITQLNDFKKLKNKLLIDRQQIADELKRKREIIYSKKAVAAKSERRSNRSKWSLDDIKPSMGGRNRRTKKAHYYSKRRRTRHYRSKRVRSK